MNGLFGSVGGVGAGQPQSPFMDMMGRGQRTMQSGGFGQSAALPQHMQTPTMPGSGSDLLNGVFGAPSGAPASPQRDAIADTMTKQGTPFTPPTAQAPPSFTPGGDPLGLGRQSLGNDVVYAAGNAAPLGENARHLYQRGGMGDPAMLEQIRAKLRTGVAAGYDPTNTTRSSDIFGPAGAPPDMQQGPALGAMAGGGGSK